MRKLVGCILLMCACGPSAEEEANVSWVLGSFSRQSITVKERSGIISRITFDQGGVGEYAELTCGGGGVFSSFVWHVRAGGVRASPPEGSEMFAVGEGDTAPRYVDVWPSEECDSDGLQLFNVDVYEPGGGEPLQDIFYKSNPCLSDRINNNPAPPCPPGLECGEPDICELFWCDGTPPRDCEP